ADFLTRYRSQAFSFVSNGSKKHHHIVYSSRQYTTYQNPQCSWKIAKLCGQYGSDKRPGRCNRCKMVSEKDILVGCHIIFTIGKLHCRCNILCIEAQHFIRHKNAIKAVSDRK